MQGAIEVNVGHNTAEVEQKGLGTGDRHDLVGLRPNARVNRQAAVVSYQVGTLSLCTCSFSRSH
jgi:hypothetical protein